MRELLTKHFHLDEFACRGENCCGHSAPMEILYIEKLEIFRRLLGGKKLIVSSGFRCLAYNETISKPTSQHCRGVAADIPLPDGINSEMMFIVAKESKLFGGVGIYDTFIHLDNGPKERIWDERS